MIALCRFPLWRKSFDALCEICDEVYVRFDFLNGDPEIMRELAKVNPTKVPAVTVSKDAWTPPDWREECLRMLDGSDADIVLCPDEDEVFGPGLLEELEEFYKSDRQGMMFSYEPLAARDGRVINEDQPYPPEPHMKAFKWKKGLSYFPYHGNAVISAYVSAACRWNARTKIVHYAAYTPKLEAGKRWRSDTPHGRGKKVVSILGFGPSSFGKLAVSGEVWSLNNCYNAFDKASVRRITRVFEMHKFGPRQGGHWDATREYLKHLEAIGSEKKYLVDGELQDRNNLKMEDGSLHINNLAAMTRAGHRVIMQEPHPQIPGSESYPLSTITERLGVDWFAGTPCYMVALAIYEGFTEIRTFGVDQMDWEHTLQRECFIFWMGIAHGAGIKIRNGALTFLSKYKKRYGYDYGPEWCPYQKELLWSGHPVEMDYKMASRVVGGQPYDGRR